ncbi:MAG: DUF1934 family protein [Erysipelotrichaceae bacterium]
MKVKVLVTHKNLSINTKKILTKTLGKLNNNTLSYLEDDGSSMKLILQEDQVVIIRQSEAEIKYTCKQNTYSEMLISNEVGEFALQIYTHQLEIKNDSLLLDYEIINGNDNDRFLINWQFLKEKE